MTLPQVELILTLNSSNSHKVLIVRILSQLGADTTSLLCTLGLYTDDHCTMGMSISTCHSHPIYVTDVIL
jgi:hypothetical protein